MESFGRLVYICLILQLYASFGSAEYKCNDRQFKCKDGKQCIPLNWRCDGEPDCRDRSDETNCRYKPCTSEEFLCSTKKCIAKADLCDGFDDCPGGDDEKIERCGKKPSCNSTTHFQCGRGEVKCVPLERVCDGKDDCSDMSDENFVNCNLKKGRTSNICRPDEFNCTGGGCISLSFKCDGKKDCADNSDEDENICKNTKGKCGSDEFHCVSDDKCISLVKRCDTFHDCKDGSDERNCKMLGLTYSTKCPLDTDFYCGIPGKCITQAWQCDGEPDCPNAADERDCTTTTCPPPKLACNKGNKCLHPSQKCDGLKDCPDGSDEEECPAAPKTNHCNNSSKFTCGSRKNGCVDWSLVCNNKIDCVDGEDEHPGGKSENCKLNPCKHMNGGCTHTCVNRYTHRVCECPKGLKLQPDKETCVDIDECKMWGSCSQKCENTKGSFKCTCAIGYAVDGNDNTRCIANSPKSLLLATQEYIRQYRIDNSDERMIVSDLINVAGLEYDIHSEPKVVFWTQPTPPALYMTKFGSATKQPKTEVFSQSGSLPEGLAYDWVHKLLYMSDPGLKRIAVLNVSSPSKKVAVIATGDIDEPRALAVDPLEGWLYWTDWGRKAMISKIGMNGQFRQVLVESEIVLPNALALDMPQRRLYWCDAKLHTISTVDLNGNDRRLIYKDPDIYPYAMSVFEDRIYWSDWFYESVMSVNKFQATTHKTLFNSHRISAIRVMHKLMQPRIPSRCTNHKCSHFCLPAPRAGKLRNDPLYSCACPEGLILRSDDRTCIKNITVRSTTKLPQTEVTTSFAKSTDKVRGATSPESSTISDVKSTSAITPKGTSSGSVTLAPNTVETKTTASSNNSVLYKEDKRVGHVAGIAIGVIILIFVVAGVIMLILYRIYSRKNIRSMNFDNPVYRKANDGDAEAQFPINGSAVPQTRLTTRSPIWTGGVANDAVEA